MTRTVITYMLMIVAPGPAQAVESPTSAPIPITCEKDTGYRNIWYAGETSKYDSGGPAAARISNIPMACYAKKPNKTFFVYHATPEGCHTSKEKPITLDMISYYDHTTKMVPRPTILLKRKNNHQHRNTTLTLDSDGYLWVFIGTNTKDEQAYIFKSTKPYDITSFRLVKKTNFSNPQCWYLDNTGFLLIYSRLKDGCRQLCCTTSPDGFNWTEPQMLAALNKGHDAVSWRHANKVALAFNLYHNKDRQSSPTNIYYMETSDFGRTWRNAGKRKINLPLKTVENPALVRDYGSQKWSIYLQDLNIDRFGNPIILYIMNRGSASSQQKIPCIWSTARWFGRDWEFAGQIRSDSKHDIGCLHIEKDNSLRLIGPTQTGPQPAKPGGEIVMWTTSDQGRSWYKHPMTEKSRFNHNCVRRPVDAHPDFDTFWCDGYAEKPSASRLYFADKTGKVLTLPTTMTKDFENPKPLKSSPDK